MNLVKLIPVILSLLLMAAHFSRAQINGLAFTCLLLPFLLLIQRQWVARIIQLTLLLGSLEWIRTTFRLIEIRQFQDQSWTRLAVILGCVALFTAASVFSFRARSLRKRYIKKKTDNILIITFILTSFLLALIQLKVKIPMLILERFIPGFGWLEVLVLTLYGVWVTEKMLDPRQSASWRFRIWILFSIVFFSQLFLGLIGIEKFLMSGKLHLPVPAMIIAGPLFRGTRFFMPILFLSTIILTGPAWCSYLCYFGAWDNWAARHITRSKKFWGHRRTFQFSMLALVLIITLILKSLAVPSTVAVIFGLSFGIIGIGIMLIWSRNKGVMAHCTAYCPIGLLATTLGKISPFRIRINNQCTSCLACSAVCRYDALRKQNIQNRRPAASCTLCGDCIGSCNDQAIEYRFPGFSANSARIVFIVLIVVVHTIFMGVARI